MNLKRVVLDKSPLKKRFLLLVNGLFFSICIGYYFIGWVFLYGFGYVYYLLEIIDIKSFLPFRWFVIGISLLVIAWIFLKVKNAKIWSLVFQDIMLILFSYCFFVQVLPIFSKGLDDAPLAFNPVYLIIVLNVLVVSLHDWVKLKR